MAARTAEERIALIDAKIAKKKEEIKALEAQKQKILHPVTMRSVMEKAKAAGLTAEEIAEKMENITPDEARSDRTILCTPAESATPR